MCWSRRCPPRRSRHEGLQPPGHAGVDVAHVLAFRAAVEEPGEVLAPLRVREREVDPHQAGQRHDVLPDTKRALLRVQFVDAARGCDGPRGFGTISMSQADSDNTRRLTWPSRKLPMVER